MIGALWWSVSTVAVATSNVEWLGLHVSTTMLESRNLRAFNEIQLLPESKQYLPVAACYTALLIGHAQASFLTCSAVLSTDNCTL